MMKFLKQFGNIKKLQIHLQRPKHEEEYFSCAFDSGLYFIGN